jgi:hypothetical protein
MPPSELFGIDLSVFAAHIFNFKNAECMNQLFLLIFLVFLQLALRQHCEATLSLSCTFKVLLQQNFVLEAISLRVGEVSVAQEKLYMNRQGMLWYSLLQVHSILE